MSSFISSILDPIFGSCEGRLLMVGLDGPGKTTIVYMLKLGECITTIPTIGFNVETIRYKNIDFTLWDVGGRDKIRPLWRHYYQNTQGIIFVVDSNDRERVDDSAGYNGSAKNELHRMLSEHELRDAAVLVFANKQDLPNAMSVEEVSQRLELHTLQNRNWHIQGSCALTGDGLWEGLEWLATTLRSPTSYRMSNVRKNYNEWQQDKADEKQKKVDEMEKQNALKIILAISGYIRDVVSKQQLMTYVPSHVSKLIHKYIQNETEYFDDKYKYYGENVENDSESDTHMAKQEILIQFLAKKDVDPNYIVDDDAFLEQYINNKL